MHNHCGKIKPTCEIERMLILAFPRAPKNIPDTPGELLILSPTAAITEQLLMTLTADIKLCFSS